MYGIFTNICPNKHPNVGKYTIHWERLIHFGDKNLPKSQRFANWNLWFHQETWGLHSALVQYHCLQLSPQSQSRKERTPATNLSKLTQNIKVSENWHRTSACLTMLICILVLVIQLAVSVNRMSQNHKELDQPSNWAHYGELPSTLKVF